MAGVLLETVSNKRLIIFSAILFIVQIIFFLIGGLVSPAPNNVISLSANVCPTKMQNNSDKWIARGEKSCEFPLQSVPYDNSEIKDGGQIIFSAKFPLARDRMQLPMSPWHQNMIAVLRIDFDSQFGNKEKVPEYVVFDAKLGYKDVGQDKWTEISSSDGIKRLLHCKENPPAHMQDELEQSSCDLIPLFELGSIHHVEYLVNIAFPSKSNPDLIRIEDIWIYVIHQNGGFTFVWFTIKTILFPVLAIALVWYVWKLSQLNRNPNVLERTLLAVGTAITLLNFPVDWLTLWINMPFMLLYSDIRQGLFYSVLLCFWIIFSGEHRMDQVKRDSLRHYGIQLGAVACCCIFMFLFDICERGIQLSNPFFSVWSTKTGSNFALVFVILAGVSAGTYLIYLLVNIGQVFKNICIKRSALPGMSKPRQKYYKNLIYRFSFLMTLTLLCAIMTFVMYTLGQVEGGMQVFNREVHFASAVQTGVYGMWNIYVFCLLVLYSPSTKYTPIIPIETSTEENVEFSTMPSETATLKTLFQKSAIE